MDEHIRITIKNEILKYDELLNCDSPTVTNQNWFIYLLSVQVNKRLRISFFLDKLCATETHKYTHLIK